MKKYLAIDTETTGLWYRLGCRAFMVTACDTEGTLYCWEFPVDPFTREVDYTSKPSKAEIENMYKVFSEYDEYIFHNALFDLPILDYFGKKFTNLFNSKVIHDTMFMCHAYNSNLSKGLKETAYYYFNFPEDDEKKLQSTVVSCRRIASKLGWAISEPTHPHLRPMKKDKPKSDYWLPQTLQRLHPELIPYDMNTSVCSIYGKKDAERTICLFKYLSEKLQQKEPNLPTTRWEQYLLNQKCILPTKRMQDYGFQVKNKELPNNLRKLKNKKTQLQRKLCNLISKPDFNPKSPIDLKEVLFEKLKLPIIKFTAKGNESTDKETLEELLEQPILRDPPDSIPKKLTATRIEFVETLLSFRKLESVERYLNSYNLHMLNGKLFPSLQPVGTKTVRFSCQNPNTQNISKLPQKGYEHLGVVLSLRGMFGPPPGKIWVCIDYKQLQLCIFAYACKDKKLIYGFENDLDIHDIVAKEVFSTKKPTSDERRSAKGINFGIIFGAGRAKIENMTKRPGSFDKFKSRFPLVDKFIKSQEHYAKELGFCKTMGGYPLVVQKSKAYKACNYIVQGTEGELVKEAFINVDAYCQKKNVPFTPVMLVHDEIIFESKINMTKDEVTTKYKTQLNRICSIMTNASKKYGVVTQVDYKITDNLWSEAD